MELRQFRHLLVLAETASFSRAAERLHLTQSALSRSILGLEQELGGRLLDRIGKRNELTPMGQAVLERARRIVQEADDLRGNLAQLRAGHLGALRVGLSSGPGAMLMVPLLRHLAAESPGARLEIARGAIELQLTRLRARELDALVLDMRSLVPAPDLAIRPVADMRAGFICRAGHPLARRRQVRFDDLLAYPIASTPLSDEVARLLVERYGAQADPARLVSLRCEDVASLIEAVSDTDAIFLGIRAAARRQLAERRLAQLRVTPALEASARFAIVTLAGRTEGPNLTFLRDFVARHLKD